MKKVTILGGGVTGVSLGHYLGKEFDVSIIDKNAKVGGMAGSFKHKKNVLDFGPHKLYSQLPGIMEEFKLILGKENTLNVKKKNSIYLLGKHFDFPAKIFQIILGINPIKSIELGIGFGISMLKGAFSSTKPKTYEQYFIKGFGKPAYKLLFRDLAIKLWGNPKTLAEELGRRRVPIPNILELVFGSKKEVSAKNFYYPKKGGVSEVSSQFAKNVVKNNGKIHLNSAVEKITINNNLVESITYKQNGKLITEKTDFLASSIYLSDLLNAISPKPPISVLAAADSLKYRSLVLVFLVVNKPKIMKDNWVFFPERKFVFNRISEHNSFNRKLVERGKAVLTAEITCNLDSDMYNSNDEYYFRRVIDGLEAAGILKESEVEEFVVKKAKRVYPVYDLNYKSNLSKILNYLGTIPNLITLGRQGLYNYNNMDHCIDMSLKTADYIKMFYSNQLSNKELSNLWNDSLKYFDNYKIVD